MSILKKTAFLSKLSKDDGHADCNSDATGVAGGIMQMQNKIETQKAENTILRQKLQSKAEALLILTKELNKVRNEGDEYRELVRKLQTQCTTLKTTSEVAKETIVSPANLEDFALMVSEDHSESMPGFTSFNSRTFRDRVAQRKLSDLREENKSLLLERENIKRNLVEREEDVKLLRDQIKKHKTLQDSLKEQLEQRRVPFKQSHLKRSTPTDPELIRQLEVVQMKYSRLKQDLQSLFDEREDLVQERDAYKCKVHRMNHAMAALLKSDCHKFIDLDCLLTENLYLKESLEQIREEKTLANEMGRKYKVALEQAAQSTSSMRRSFSSNDSKVTSAANETQLKVTDDIKRLLAQTVFPFASKNSVKDLSSPQVLQDLCLNLLETLNDRMLQLKHQRRANKQILQQLEETENRIMSFKPANSDKEEVMDIGQILLHPSQHLMKGYNSKKTIMPALNISIVDHFFFFVSRCQCG